MVHSCLLLPSFTVYSGYEFLFPELTRLPSLPAPNSDLFYHGASLLLHSWDDSSLPYPHLTFSMPNPQTDKNMRQLFAGYLPSVSSPRVMWCPYWAVAAGPCPSLMACVPFTLANHQWESFRPVVLSAAKLLSPPNSPGSSAWHGGKQNEEDSP